MWTKGLLLLNACIGLVMGASVVHCPEGSENCQGTVLKESSFEFLNKLTEKESRIITSLTISNASIEKVDPKVKRLKNLEYLDLSHNNVKISTLPSLPNLKTLKLNSNTLKNIDLTLLPKNLEELDISNNLLARIPSEWNTLKSLKILHLLKNPFDCECANYNVLRYDDMVKHGIIIPEVVTCYSPKHFSGKDIALVNCSQADIMQYDEPAVEGSGLGDIFEENIGSSHFDHLNEEDAPEDNTIIDDKIADSDEKHFLMDSNETSNHVETTEEEGSGDEGSGFAPIVVDAVPACHVNCSSPKPVGTEDEVNASPLPNLIHQMNIIGGDVYNGLKGEEPDETASTKKATTFTPYNATEVTEEPIIKEAAPKQFRGSDKSDVEVFNNMTETSETKGAFIVNQNSSAVYIVVGICLLLTIVFIVCLVKKRRNRRRNRRPVPPGFGEEMKPLSKSPVEIINEKPANNIPEHIPLINGQNGKKHNDNTPVLKSFTPLAHPEILEEDEEEEKAVENEEVEVREKINPELLTPPRERVTVRASEIPDSIPKTPVLVHRQKNSDGEIVTTVLPP